VPANLAGQRVFLAVTRWFRILSDLTRNLGFHVSTRNAYSGATGGLSWDVIPPST
jgi:hypothetical protein